jgi:hypothetical protein
VLEGHRANLRRSVRPGQGLGTRGAGWDDRRTVSPLIAAGRIVAAGYTADGGDAEFALLRANP